MIAVILVVCSMTIRAGRYRVRNRASTNTANIEGFRTFWKIKVAIGFVSTLINLRAWLRVQPHRCHHWHDAINAIRLGYAAEVVDNIIKYSMNVLQIRYFYLYKMIKLAQQMVWFSLKFKLELFHRKIKGIFVIALDASGHLTLKSCRRFFFYA